MLILIDQQPERLQKANTLAAGYLFHGRDGEESEEGEDDDGNKRILGPCRSLPSNADAAEMR